MSPDTIVLARTVHTLDDGHRAADPVAPVGAVAVRDGLIAAVGTAADARDWRGPGTEVIDLGDAVLVPGLVDGHSHPAFGLELATGADLSAVRDLDGLRAALARAERLDGWVLAWNLDHNAFGGHPVHRSVLEDVLGPDTPAFVRLYDGHSALATGAALRAAGITGARAFAQRATVVCDPDGTPTGHLIEHAAMDLVTAVLPRLPLDRRRDALHDLLLTMAAGGLAGAHVMDAGGDILELVRAIEDTRHLPLRLRIAPWCMPGTGAEGLRELASLQGESGRNWLVGGVKLFVDGTVEGGSAWLERPDCHGEGTAGLWLDPPNTPTWYGSWTRTGSAPRRTRSATRACGTSWTPSPRCPGTAAAGTGSSTSRHSATNRPAASPGWASPRPCSPPTPRTPGPTTPTPGPPASAPNAPTAPGSAAPCATLVPPSPSAPTGRSPTTTRAASSPTPGCAATPAPTPRPSTPARPSPR